MPLTDPDRRSLLRALALCPVGALAMPAWADSAADELGLIAANVCLLTPETTEGPYYIDPRLMRADITEGRPGVPLALALQVVDADCRPLQAARVDVWHCDAAGDYSGFARQGSDRTNDTRGETFLRGTLETGTGGVARFATVWPGWYRGRTPHIHFKVFLDRRTMLTSQLFFPDGVSEQIYRAAAPYEARAAAQDTTNANDGIARRAGPAAVARVSGDLSGMQASLVVGVDA